jgi:hypothetical protein
MAGKQIITLLRKLHAGGEVNWVEALPRALRLHHDKAGITGYSPYQIVFGRERNLPGLPYSTPLECMEAQDFLEHMGEMDRTLAQALNQIHDEQKARHNGKQRARPVFKVGDRVWVLKPKPLRLCPCGQSFR